MSKFERAPCGTDDPHGGSGGGALGHPQGGYPPQLNEPGIRVHELGHVTLFVRDVEASARFYRDVLRLIDRGRAKGGRIAFFSAGAHHHDLACEAVGPDAPAPTPGAPGLYHIAFKVGATVEELEAARRSLQALGLPVFGDWVSENSHAFSTRDPDGHEIELYVELAGPGRETPKPDNPDG